MVAPPQFGGVVKLLVSAAAVAALAWFAVPWVSMACRGTLDRCALDAMRREAVVPAPRQPPDDAPARDVIHAEARSMPYSAN